MSWHRFLKQASLSIASMWGAEPLQGLSAASALLPTLTVAVSPLHKCCPSLTSPIVQSQYHIHQAQQTRLPAPAALQVPAASPSACSTPGPAHAACAQITKLLKGPVPSQLLPSAETLTPASVALAILKGKFLGCAESLLLPVGLSSCPLPFTLHCQQAPCLPRITGDVPYTASVASAEVLLEVISISSSGTAEQVPPADATCKPVPTLWLASAAVATGPDASASSEAKRLLSSGQGLRVVCARASHHACSWQAACQEPAVASAGPACAR